MRSGLVGALAFAATLAGLALWLPEVAGDAAGFAPAVPPATESRAAAPAAESPAGAATAERGDPAPKGRPEEPRRTEDVLGPVPAPERPGLSGSAGSPVACAVERLGRFAPSAASAVLPSRGARTDGVSPSAPLSLRI